MELSDRHLEAIRKQARTIEYGKVIINISAASKKLDLVVENHLRLDEDESPTERKNSKKT